ncbi:MAG: tetratricopeptide repeat protein, partial [bacterium]
PAEAETIYREAIKAAKEIPITYSPWEPAEASLALARYYSETGRFADALTTAKDALEYNNDQEQRMNVLEWIGGHYLQHNNLDEAIAWYRNGLEHFSRTRWSGWSWLHSLINAIALKDGLEAAVSLGNDLLTQHRDDSEVVETVLKAMAYSSLETGNIEKAKGFLEKLETSSPDKEKMDLRSLKLSLALAEKNYDEALKVARTLSYTCGGKRSFYADIVQSNLSAVADFGDVKKTEEKWRQNLMKYPECETDDGYEICWGAIKFYLLSGRYSEAHKIAKILSNRKFVEHWNYSYEHKDLAHLFALAGDSDDAGKCLAKIGERDSGKINFILSIGEVYYHIGETEKARQYFDRIVKVYEKEGYTDVPDYALALTYMGDMKKAVQLIGALLKMFPRDSDTLVAAAKIYRLAGDDENADACIETLISTRFFSYFYDLSLAYAMKK